MGGSTERMGWERRGRTRDVANIRSSSESRHSASHIVIRDQGEWEEEEETRDTRRHLVRATGNLGEPSSPPLHRLFDAGTPCAEVWREDGETDTGGTWEVEVGTILTGSLSKQNLY